MITDDAGQLQRIVEQKDANAEEAAVQLVNSGIYAFNRDQLFACLHQLRPNNAQGEYYLTDVPKLLVSSGERVGLVISEQPQCLLGVNTLEQLAEVEQLAIAGASVGWRAAGHRCQASFHFTIRLSSVLYEYSHAELMTYL